MNNAAAGETDNEPIIQTVAEPLQQYLQKAAASDEPVSGTPPPRANSNKALAFRPTNRQPLAALTILDDGSRDDGEVIRIRESRFSIGREKGNVTIPFDADMSGRHAELRCQRQKGRFRWYLIDKNSTNGSFVRAFRASLSRETELTIGSRRYLFQLPDQNQQLAETDALQTQAYQAPSRTLMEQFVPRLSEVGGKESKACSFSIGRDEVYIGSDPRCQIAIQDDPFVSPKHARLYQDESGRWMIEDQKSLNGVWIRVKKFAMDRQVEFQLGQQRFQFQPSFA